MKFRFNKYQLKLKIKMTAKKVKLFIQNIILLKLIKNKIGKCVNFMIQRLKNPIIECLQ